MKEIFADRDSNIGVLIELELDTARLDFLYRLGGVVANSAGLGIRHKASWSKNFSKLANLAHGRRGCDCNIKIGEPALNFFYQILKSYKFRTGLLSRSSGRSRSKNKNPDIFPASVWKRTGASDHLVTLLGIHTETNRDCDCLIEFCGGHFLEDGKCVVQGVFASLLHEFTGSAIAFTAIVGHMVLQYERSEDLLRLFVGCIGKDIPEQKLSFDLDAHLAGCAGEGAKSGLLTSCVHVLDLDLHNIQNLFLGEFRYLDLVWLLGAGSNACCFLEKDACRWGLGDECKVLSL